MNDMAWSSISIRRLHPKFWPPDDNNRTDGAMLTPCLRQCYVPLLMLLHVRLPTGALPLRLRAGDYFRLLNWLALF
jgi:hypothetical protein